MWLFLTTAINISGLRHGCFSPQLLLLPPNWSVCLFCPCFLSSTLCSVLSSTVGGPNVIQMKSFLPEKKVLTVVPKTLLDLVSVTSSATCLLKPSILLAVCKHTVLLPRCFCMYSFFWLEWFPLGTCEVHSLPFKILVTSSLYYLLSEVFDGLL